MFPYFFSNIFKIGGIKILQLKYVVVERGMCIKASIQTQSGDVIVRQCANYNPPLWKDDFIQSLHNEFRVWFL